MLRPFLKGEGTGRKEGRQGSSNHHWSPGLPGFPMEWRFSHGISSQIQILFYPGPGYTLPPLPTLILRGSWHNQVFSDDTICHSCANCKKIPIFTQRPIIIQQTKSSGLYTEVLVSYFDMKMLVFLNDSYMSNSKCKQKVNQLDLALQKIPHGLLSPGSPPSVPKCFSGRDQ